MDTGDVRSFEEHTPDYYNHVVSVDQFGVYLGTASIFGYMAAKGSFAYQAAKAAVVMMTKSETIPVDDGFLIFKRS